MTRRIFNELLFFPEVGKVEIVRTNSIEFQIKKNKEGQLRAFAHSDLKIQEIRYRVEKYLQQAQPK